MSKYISLQSFTTLFLFFLVILQTHVTNSCFNRIFSFGDSITDTGNLLRTLGDNYDPIQNLPYGETFFGRATGRFSNGRLIIDFLAKEYGLPFLPAYLVGKNASRFRHGANFAVGGATAINNSFFVSKGIHGKWPDYPLGIQIEWFKKLLPSVLLDSGSNNIMNSSLFLMGEIGGNDYNGAFITCRRNIAEVQKFVPLVTQTIGSSIIELIKFGAKTLLVPGNFPIGCMPSYLTTFESQNEEDYEPDTGCIKRLNSFSQYHNAMLNKELDRLRKLYPNVTIIYADYFRASMNIFRDPKKFGFGDPLIACCGSEGRYNYNASISCGEYGSTVCSNPSEYVSWDGIHMTEATYKFISDEILHNSSYTSPPLAQACSNIYHIDYASS
ncbi:hypothetical protein LUZ60_000593 [Juncus effusus]|nr:hypothetical protein LUZ60_000593 [Juncus effusus]